MESFVSGNGNLDHAGVAGGERPGDSASLSCSVHQKTLKSAIQCTGTALHSGAKVMMSLQPAEPGTGILFRRTDIAGRGATILARWDNVTDTRMCTTIGAGAASIATVEHLMAALAGCEVDNAIIEVSGPEVPVMDGSAEPFVFLIECAGIVEQNAARRGVRVLRPVSVEDDDRFAALTPDDQFSITFEIDFDSPAIARQECTFRLVNGTFKSDICRARTFGFLHERDQLMAAGLARGGSLDNAVVVSGDRILNEGGLRYANEFVRHKVLDSIGDMYLAGGPIIGHFHGHQSGHMLNNRLLRALFADPANWAYTDLPAVPAAIHAPAETVEIAAPQPRRAGAR